MTELFDVAVVGYGPVGAVLANLLGRDGVRTAVLERDAGIHQLPRAVHFDHEIRRILQSIGLSADVLTDTAPIEGYEFWNGNRDTLFRFGIGQGVTHQGWRQDYMFHQPSLEKSLRDAVARRDSVEVRLQQEVVGLDERDDHVVLQVRDLVAGETREIGARYVVGCDGANSAIRKRAGLTLDDLEFDEGWLVVDAIIDKPRQELGLPIPAVQLCDPARPVSFIPVAGPYIRWEFMLRPGEAKEEMLRRDRVVELIAAWCDPGSVEVIRTAVYDFHALVAQRWNTRRAFLAGDAAHQMPPFLGQGMCSGMRDAANLAWKLKLVLRGAAGDSMLASYQSERDPHVRALINIAIALGHIICTQDADAAAARDADFLSRAEREPAPPDMPGIGPGVLQASAVAGKLGLQADIRDGDGNRKLLDDVVGAGFVLLSRAAPTPLSATARRLCAELDCHLVSVDATVDIDGAYGQWFDRCGCDAILVRPDHVVFGTAVGASAASTLLEELGAALRGGTGSQA